MAEMESEEMEVMVEETVETELAVTVAEPMTKIYKIVGLTLTDFTKIITIRKDFKYNLIYNIINKNNNHQNSHFKGFGGACVFFLLLF